MYMIAMFYVPDSAVIGDNEALCGMRVLVSASDTYITLRLISLPFTRTACHFLVCTICHLRR